MTEKHRKEIYFEIKGKQEVLINLFESLSSDKKVNASKKVKRGNNEQSNGM